VGPDQRSLSRFHPKLRLKSSWDLTLEKARILIVEDEALIAEDLRCTVLMLGYAVVAVTESGEQAVQEALELRPDLVLLDYQLQGPMNGVEAGKLIQQAVTAAVVFVSANANVLAQPFVVQKPFSRTTLSLVIAAALASSRNDHG